MGHCRLSLSPPSGSLINSVVDNPDRNGGTFTDRHPFQTRSLFQLGMGHDFNVVRTLDGNYHPSIGPSYSLIFVKENFFRIIFKI